MSSEMESISIAIVTYGVVTREIKICLKSLEKEIKVNDEILIIHEGNDLQFKNIESLAKENKHKIKCVRLIENRGLSNGRNLALDICKTKWITFIDDDAKLLDGWREALDRGFTRYPDSPGFTGPLIPIYETDIRKLPPEMEWVVSCDSFGGKIDKTTRNGFGANMTFNNDKLNEYNLKFDSKLGWVGGHEGVGLAGEETVFSMKINEYSEYPIMWLYDLKVGHHVPMTRMTLRYVINRSRKEGRTKSYISKNTISGSSSNSLGKEIKHLIKTIFIGIPREIIRIPIKPTASLWNISGIILMITNTGLGFIGEKMSRKKN